MELQFVPDQVSLLSDAEIHHVHKHSEGGKTTLENGVLVHKGCHPKGEKQENAFAEKWKSKAG